MKLYDDVFFKSDNGTEHCLIEKALSILLKHNVLFCNTREYIEREWIYETDENGHIIQGSGKPTDKYTIEPETIVLFVNCNDLFYWGCADSEHITREEIPAFYRMWRNVPDGVAKWCCKKRNQKPQQPVIECMKNRKVWEDWMDKLNDGE